MIRWIIVDKIKVGKLLTIYPKIVYPARSMTRAIFSIYDVSLRLPLVEHEYIVYTMYTTELMYIVYTMYTTVLMYICCVHTSSWEY